jgi:hypothetical protein
MRAMFEVPKEKPYVLGDLTVKGVPLEFGGQLAGLYYSLRLPRIAQKLAQTL